MSARRVGMSESMARELVYGRSSHWCEVRREGTCLGVAGNWHHRKSAGRVWTPSNGLHLCGSGTTGCHGWITEHPADAYKNGWMVRSSADPALAPVYAWRPHATGPQWLLLDDYGGAVEIEGAELAAQLAEVGMGKVA